MAEIIILDEWKKKKAIEELQLLQEEIDAIMEFLATERQYFMFDSVGNPVLIHSEPYKKANDND